MKFALRDPGRTLLLLGGIVSLGIALVHLFILLLGPPAYLYFGAADLARLAAGGSPVPAVLTFLLALAFSAFGLYALSAAGTVRRLPLLKLGLIFIAGLYTLRGLILFLDLFRLWRGDGYPLRQTFFSGVSLGAGLIYFAGLFQKWKDL